MLRLNKNPVIVFTNGIVWIIICALLAAYPPAAVVALAVYIFIRCQVRDAARLRHRDALARQEAAYGWHNETDWSTY